MTREELMKEMETFFKLNHRLEELQKELEKKIDKFMGKGKIPLTHEFDGIEQIIDAKNFEFEIGYRRNRTRVKLVLTLARYCYDRLKYNDYGSRITYRNYGLRITYFYKMLRRKMIVKGVLCNFGLIGRSLDNTHICYYQVSNISDFQKIWETSKLKADLVRVEDWGVGRKRPIRRIGFGRRLAQNVLDANELVLENQPAIGAAFFDVEVYYPGGSFRRESVGVGIFKY